jgi:UDP-N-acetylglucosamine:LPS N-acetylglucosamine transferase
MLVCNPGGHLMQMLALRPAWEDLPRTWVTLRAADTEALLLGERTSFAHAPTERSITNLLRNLWLSVTVMRRDRPDVLLSTGGGVTVPLFIIGKLIGTRLVYVESISRVHEPSLSGKLVYPLVDRFFVQWPEAATRRRMEFVGHVL